MIDESHATVPQIGAMYKGDRSRKTTLVEFGFRLPSALDNRPLRFDEFEALAPQTVFVSATPGPYEKETSDATDADGAETVTAVEAAQPLLTDTDEYSCSGEFKFTWYDDDGSVYETTKKIEVS